MIGGPPAHYGGDREDPAAAPFNKDDDGDDPDDDGVQGTTDDTASPPPPPLGDAATVAVPDPGPDPGPDPAPGEEDNEVDSLPAGLAWAPEGGEAAPLPPALACYSRSDKKQENRDEGGGGRTTRGSVCLTAYQFLLEKRIISSKHQR